MIRPLLALAVTAVLSPAPDGGGLPDPAERGGYFLSARFAEDRSVPGVREAVARMSEGALAFTPRDEVPPGYLLGHVSSPLLAVAFMHRWIFERALGPALPGPPREVPAPVVGGPAAEGAQLHLLELRVTGSTADGDLREIAWPSFAGAIVPPEVPWAAAALTTRHAPLFAAPGPTLPPANEAHAVVSRDGGLYALGELDRCRRASDGALRCLRWEQVVARDGDAFRGGYLPAHLVAHHEDWTPAVDALPRASARAYALSGGRVHIMLTARDAAGVLRSASVSLPAPGGVWPEVSVSVLEQSAVVSAGPATTTVAINETMGQRPPPASP